MTRLCTRDLMIRRGGSVILEGVSLSLGPGLVALVGANGSGKSTLLRALAGIQPPTRGSIEIDGHDLWREPVAARQRLGYLPESPELFPYLTPRELLRTANAVRGVHPDAGHERFVRGVSREALDLRIGSLSAGQRRKLGLVAATTHAPPVVLLDEPANTLDAAAQDDLRALLLRWQTQGHTVLVATHRPQAYALPFDQQLIARDRCVVPG